MPRITIIPDRLAHYRVPVFDALAKSLKNVQLRVEADLGEDKSGISKPNKYELIRVSFEFSQSTDIRFSDRLVASTASLKAPFKNSDVVVIWGDAGAVGNWISALTMKIFTKKKIVFWTHGLYGKESALLRNIRLKFYGLADALLLYGLHSKRLLSDNGFPKDKLYVINNSLDFGLQNNLFSSNQESSQRNLPVDGVPKLKLIFVGRLTIVKKLHLLLRALVMLNEHDSVELRIVGDGQVSSELKTLARELGIQSSVKFLGAVYDEKILSTEIMNADIMVSPGNVGLTAMHSLVYGTPVVTHSNMNNQMPEAEAIKENVSGCLFEEDDVTSLADSIMKCKKKINENVINHETCRSVIFESYSTAYQTRVFHSMLEDLGVINESA